jgi:hypothetical protein
VALVLAGGEAGKDFMDDVGRNLVGFGDGGGWLPFLDVGGEDSVEGLVGRQGVLINLVGAELGGGWLGEGGVGDEGSVAIDVVSELVDRSDLLPVLRTRAPNLLARAMRKLPRMRAWMFSSVTSSR